MVQPGGMLVAVKADIEPDPVTVSLFRLAAVVKCANRGGVSDGCRAVCAREMGCVMRYALFNLRHRPLTERARIKSVSACG